MAREIAHHASEETEQELIDMARKLPRSELRDQLKKKRPRRNNHRKRPTMPRPGVSTKPTKVPDVPFLQLRMNPPQLAQCDSLITQLQKADNGRPRIELVLGAMAAALSQDINPEYSLPPHHLVIIPCRDCGDAKLVTSRGEAEVPAPLLRAAQCDAIIEDNSGGRRRTIPERTRRLALQKARMRCEAEGCQNTQFLNVHHRRPRSLGGSNDLNNLVVLCSTCHRKLHEADEAMRDDKQAIEKAAQSYGSRPSR